MAVRTGLAAWGDKESTHGCARSGRPERGLETAFRPDFEREESTARGGRSQGEPDRLPCMRVAAATAGWNLLARAQAPESLAPNVKVVWRPEAGRVVLEVILSATSTNGLADVLPAWAKVCEDP